MEPLMPSEVARLVYGYLKKEKNDETAESFLRSSSNLTECYQMYKANRSFNIKFSGFDLHGIFDLFGTMCSMINNGVSEACESKTVIEKLQYLLDTNKMPIKKNTELKMVDKCVGSMINTEDKNICTTINMATNRSITEELEIPTFPEIISNNVPKTKNVGTVNNEINVAVEKTPIKFSSPCSTNTQLENTYNTSTPIFSKIEDTSIESPNFQILEQISSTLTKKVNEAKNYLQPSLQKSPKNMQNEFSLSESECLQIPEATSLESMPGLSKEDKSKDSSIAIDTGELVDTFLNDQSLLEKIADTINKSIEAQKETDSIQQGKILDPPTLEKALDSTQSDPQIKNVLDEFLVFNVENSDNSQKTDINIVNHQESIKSRLRSAKKKDDSLNKSKKNNLNNHKHNIYGNEESVKVDSNIILIHNDNVKTTIYENYDLLSNQFILQTNDSNVGQSYNFGTVEPELEEDYFGKSNYVKIAPKITPIMKTHPAFEKNIFPKRRRRNFEELGIRSQFRKTNIIMQPPQPPVQSPQSIIIEVPNQSSFEIQARNNLESNINRPSDVPKVLSEIKDVNKDELAHDTPDDRLKPPKNKSMSTPRRRSTHIRCLDFSTPQPKNNARDQARSKLFCDSPKTIEKIVEEPSSSPLPKLQADWGSVNGFESIVKKDTIKHWDTDIREMVGAGILTSDADGRKTRKKKTPRKKIKLVNDKNNSEVVSDELNKSNNSIETNESQTDKTIKSNISENVCDLEEPNFNKPLLDDQNTLKEDLDKFPISLETPDINTELCNKSLLTELNSLKNLNDNKSLKDQNKFPFSLETPVKTTKLCNEQLSTKSNSIITFNDKEPSNKPSALCISFETPTKVTELSNEQPSNDSESLKNISNDCVISIKSNELTTLLETPIKITEFCNKQLIESNSLKVSHETQNNLEGTSNNLNKQKNNLNTLTKTDKLPSSSETIQEIINKNKEKDSNFSETFNNHQYLKPLPINKQPKNKSSDPSENLKKQSSTDQIETNKLIELNSPEIIKIQPLKQNLIETPFKCDDSAVDVPETPISKLIREYDPSKLITPLPSTPVHYEDSLTETPLTKVFRETSYLNRPPISPFPPTPGNSMSVDTLIVPSDQDKSKSLTNISSKIKELITQPIPASVNIKTPVKKKKIKSTSLESKTKVSNKTKSNLKEKNVETKKKQVYESVKVEIFGSEISSSSSADELKNTNVQKKSIVINKKTQKEKTTGFKPIPKRKSIQSTSIIVNGTENCLLNKSNTTLNKSCNKPTILQNNESFSKNNNTKIKKSKKSMVHFDDPVKKICYSPINLTPQKSDNTIAKTQEKTVIGERSEQLIGLSRYLNKPTTFYDCKEINNKIKPEVKTSKLNSSDFSLNYANKSNEKISNSSSNVSRNSSKNNQKNKNVENCIIDSINKKSIKNDKSDEKVTKASMTVLNNKKNKSDNLMTDENKKSNVKEENASLNESNVLLDSVHPGSFDVKTLSQNFTSKKFLNNLSLEQSNQTESTSINYANSVNNASCITFGHKDGSFPFMKDDETLNNIEYLKKPKVYEVITEDGEREMLHLTLSEVFIFLDIPSEINNIQVTNSIISPLITNKVLDSTLELEAGELEENDILMPVTSTPKDVVEKKMDERQNRVRRSPSFWDNSGYNCPIKHRDDRHRDSSIRRRNNHRDNRHDKKYWPNKSRYQNEFAQFDTRMRFQKNHNKRESRDDSSRFKQHKEDSHRRNYRDYNYDERKGRDRLEESERFSSGQRISQKLNKTEDVIKKATKRPADRTDYNKTPAKVSKVEHQRLLKNVDVDDFLSVVHGRK